MNRWRLGRPVSASCSASWRSWSSTARRAVMSSAKRCTTPSRGMGVVGPGEDAVVHVHLHRAHRLPVLSAEATSWWWLRGRKPPSSWRRARPARGGWRGWRRARSRRGRTPAPGWATRGGWRPGAAPASSARRRSVTSCTKPPPRRPARPRGRGWGDQRTAASAARPVPSTPSGTSSGPPDRPRARRGSSATGASPASAATSAASPHHVVGGQAGQRLHRAVPRHPAQVAVAHAAIPAGVFSSTASAPTSASAPGSVTGPTPWRRPACPPRQGLPPGARARAQTARRLRRARQPKRPGCGGAACDGPSWARNRGSVRSGAEACCGQVERKAPCCSCGPPRVRASDGRARDGRREMDGPFGEQISGHPLRGEPPRRAGQNNRSCPRDKAIGLERFARAESHAGSAHAVGREKGRVGL
jgi:hypothetical protein